MSSVRYLGLVSMATMLVLVLHATAWSATCQLPDNGGGTVDLPPAGCDYVGESPWQIVDGLPGGATIDIDVTFSGYASIVTGAGGGLGGEFEQFDVSVEMQLTGTGALAGFNRVLFVPAQAETHSAARTPGAAVQTFATDWFSLQGQIFGDPDFCTFQIKGGIFFGLSSPGQTTLVRLGPAGSDFNVDSFFDVEYSITFAGCPGSILDGFSGTTTSGTTPGVDSVIMRTGESVAATGDHYHCYKAKDLKNPRFTAVPGVSLDDQFGNHTVDVKKPFLVCPPASKNGSGVDDAVTHLCCYKIKGPKLDPAATVQTSDQFGTLDQELKKSKILCQPCLKTLLP